MEMAIDHADDAEDWIEPGCTSTSRRRGDVSHEYARKQMTYMAAKEKPNMILSFC